MSDAHVSQTCEECWRQDHEVHRALPERYVRAVERITAKKVGAYRCQYTGSWHLALPQTPSRFRSRVDPDV